MCEPPIGLPATVLRKFAHPSVQVFLPRWGAEGRTSQRNIVPHLYHFVNTYYLSLYDKPCIFVRSEYIFTEYILPCDLHGLAKAWELFGIGDL